MPAALVLTAPQTLEVRSHPSRALAVDEVRLRVDAAGICGSDVHGFAGVNDRRPVGIVMGHETIGRVIEVGSGVHGLTVGDRVAVNPVVACGACRYCQNRVENLCVDRRLYGCSLELDGGLADEMIARASNCTAVADEADVRGLALIEPLAVGTHAVGIAQLEPESTVLVVGGGPIGIAVTLACMDVGTSAVVCEPVADRRAVAERLGADTCTPDDLPTAASRFDAAFECVGARDTMLTAVANVRPGGTVVCLGLAEPTVEIPAVPLVIEERRLLGSSAYTAADFERTARWAATRSDELADLVQVTVDLAQMPAVFADYHAGRLTALKALFVADGGGRAE